MDASDVIVIKQHLIDPEICIRCNTCESICPVSAITHDSRNYVVDAASATSAWPASRPAPRAASTTGARCRGEAYSLEAQLGWDVPARGAERRASWPAAAGGAEAAVITQPVAAPAPARSEPGEVAVPTARDYGATLPPWSAAHAYTNLYGPKAAEKTITATVAGNVRVTEVGREYDTHHIVLDFGAMPFPVLEGQSIAIVPPGLDAAGRPHHPAAVQHRQPPQRRAARLQQHLADHQARAGRPPGPPGARRGQQLHVRPEGGRQGAGHRPVRHQLPDAQPSEEPYRDDLHRHRQRADARDDGMAPPPARSGKFEGGKLMLFFGARTQRGTAVLRPAAEPAQGLHRHQPRVQPRAGPAQALRAGRDARTRRRPGASCSPTRTPTSMSAD